MNVKHGNPHAIIFYVMKFDQSKNPAVTKKGDGTSNCSSIQNEKITLKSGKTGLNITIRGSTLEPLPVTLITEQAEKTLSKPRRLILNQSNKVRSFFSTLFHPSEKKRSGWIRPSINPTHQIGSKVKFSLHDWLFIAALVIYLVTRLISLSSFPIYFFTDEAVQTVLAQDFVRDGARNYDKELLPTFFENGNQYNLSTSVYLQIIPFLLFGKSIFITRSIGVLVSLLAAAAIGLLLRNVFKLKWYWAGTLLLSITPAWFLHSRTAFETSLAVSFFAVFIYCYCMYRTIQPRYIYGAVIFGALCFYSYSPAQVVIGLLVLILWFSDLKYHLSHKKDVLIALVVALICAIPYIRFLILHSKENIEHLIILRSYWVSNTSLGTKLLTFFRQYARGLNPAYWFIPNTIDFSRHLMRDYGHILPYSLPFFIIGVIICLCNFRRTHYRGLLFVVFVSPAGAALVEIGITRALFMVIPVALITALGLDYIISLILKLRIPPIAVSLAMFAMLAGINTTMLADALIKRSDLVSELHPGRNAVWGFPVVRGDTTAVG